MKKIFNNKPRAIFWIGFTLVVLMVLVCLGILYYESNDENIVAIVNGKKITKEEYNKWAYATTFLGDVNSPQGLDDYNKASILDEMVEAEIINEESSKQSVTVSSTEVEERSKQDFPNYENVTGEEKSALESRAKYFVQLEKLKEINLGWREGYYFLCRYDRYLQDDYVGKQEAANQLKSTQQPYSQKYCADLKTRISQNSDTFEKEFAAIRSDKTIGEESWKPFQMTLGRSFGKENYNPSNFIIGSNLFDQINGVENKAGVYGPVEVKVTVNNEGTEQTEGAYAVYYLSGKGGSGQINNFEKWVENLVKDANPTLYPERI
uniref:PpiC domain-containing protein n=1 Tax=candidate division WWE3 bacterium TaxID=2053526 RepID=A0A7C4TLE1_UNCKA